MFRTALVVPTLLRFAIDPERLFAASILLMGLSALARAGDDSIIAYVAPSTGNSEIRLVAGDGTGDRRLWSMGPGNPADVGIGTLTWRPDGTEVAFDSGHQSGQALSLRDIYSVRASGTGLRRITGGPESGSFADYPQGQVTVRLRSTRNKELSVYVEGASGRVDFLAEGGVNYTVTFNSVADFGPEVRQYVRVYDYTPSLSDPCYYDIGVFADVVGGQVVDAGFMPMSVYDVPCRSFRAPAWQVDGNQILYLAKEASPSPLRQSEHHLWTIDAEPLPLEIGRRLLDYATEVSGSPLAFHIAMTPNQAVGDEMLLTEISIGDTRVVASRVSNPQARERLSVNCGKIACTVTGVAWLPDGSGFVYARLEVELNQPDTTFIYLYDGVSRQTREVTRIPGLAVGQVSVSPDGQRIAFALANQLVPGSEEFRIGPRALCPCEIWTVNIDGTDGKRIVADGRAPAWSPNASAVPPDAIFGSGFE